MYRTRSGYPSEAWGERDPDDARRSAQLQCAIARSVLGAARSVGVPVEPRCEESLFAVERWCTGAGTAAEVRSAAREVMLRRLEVFNDPDALGAWRRRICDAVLRACDEAREALDGSPLERTSQTSVF